MKYQCMFPKCDKILPKSLIEHHHVIPKEIDKSSNNTTVIPLCPLHHKLIYVPEATAGQHFINTEDSIQIIQVYDSTAGKVLQYRDYNEKDFCYFLESKEITEF